jgi:hypothetical protein
VVSVVAEVGEGRCGGDDGIKLFTCLSETTTTVSKEIDDHRQQQPLLFLILTIHFGCLKSHSLSLDPDSEHSIPMARPGANAARKRHRAASEENEEDGTGAPAVCAGSAYCGSAGGV